RKRPPHRGGERGEAETDDKMASEENSSSRSMEVSPKPASESFARRGKIAAEDVSRINPSFRFQPCCTRGWPSPPPLRLPCAGQQKRTSQVRPCLARVRAIRRRALALKPAATCH